MGRKGQLNCVYPLLCIMNRLKKWRHRRLESFKGKHEDEVHQSFVNTATKS